MRVSFLKEPNQHSIFALQDLSPTTPSLFQMKKKLRTSTKEQQLVGKITPVLATFQADNKSSLMRKRCLLLVGVFFYQPSWKKCSSKWIQFPKLVGLWNHHLRSCYPDLVHQNQHGRHVRGTRLLIRQNIWQWMAAIAQKLMSFLGLTLGADASASPYPETNSEWKPLRS